MCVSRQRPDLSTFEWGLPHRIRHFGHIGSTDRHLGFSLRVRFEHISQRHILLQKQDTVSLYIHQLTSGRAERPDLPSFFGASFGVHARRWVFTNIAGFRSCTSNHHDAAGASQASKTLRCQRGVVRPLWQANRRGHRHLAHRTTSRATGPNIRRNATPAAGKGPLLVGSPLSVCA